ncbi:transposase family protein [Rothia sp. ZJ1223]|uniref:transposase family protein n=1 Tax=Rothia sp. ZJ1223 TaxID=2811098 RepID=UPI00351C633E
METALDKILKPLIQPLEKALKAPGSLVIDGTLIPVWNWRSLGKTNFSGKHKRAGCNHQVICTIDGKLLVITDPLPGARHDAYAFKKHGLDRYLDETTLADKGYVGLGLLVPTKRKPGVKTSKAVKDNNRVINRVRAVVERVIAQIKTWRIFHTGFRRPLGSYGRVFSSGAWVGVLCGREDF